MLLEGAEPPAVDTGALAAATAGGDADAIAIAANRSPRAEAVADEEEAEVEEEATWRAEAAAADALVETAIAAVTNECPICGRRVAVERMRWDNGHWANICDGDSTCIPPAEGGRKRQRREQGGYAQMLRGSKN